MIDVASKRSLGKAREMASTSHFVLHHLRGLGYKQVGLEARRPCGQDPRVGVVGIEPRQCFDLFGSVFNLVGQPFTCVPLPMVKSARSRRGVAVFWP